MSNDLWKHCDGPIILTLTSRGCTPCEEHHAVQIRQVYSRKEGSELFLERLGAKCTNNFVASFSTLQFVAVLKSTLQEAFLIHCKDSEATAVLNVMALGRLFLACIRSNTSEFRHIYGGSGKVRFCPYLTSARIICSLGESLDYGVVRDNLGRRPWQGDSLRSNGFCM